MITFFVIMLFRKLGYKFDHHDAPLMIYPGALVPICDLLFGFLAYHKIADWIRT